VIEYDYKGIKVEATVEMEQYDYEDAGGHCRVRFDKNVKVIPFLIQECIYNPWPRHNGMNPLVV
jgi:hypothetical protein